MDARDIFYAIVIVIALFVAVFVGGHREPENPCRSNPASQECTDLVEWNP